MSLGLGCDLLPVWGFLSGQLMWAVGYGGPLVSGECHYESPTTPQQSPLSNETKKTLMTNQIHLRRCKGNNRIFDIQFVLIKIWELQCFFFNCLVWNVKGFILPSGRFLCCAGRPLLLRTVLALLVELVPVVTDNRSSSPPVSREFLYAMRGSQTSSLLSIIYSVINFSR